MSNYNYEIEGRVKISGKWYEIGHCGIEIEDAAGGGILYAPRDIAGIIEAYEPPKPKPFEWVPKHYNLNQARDGMTHHESLNAWITENYGDPTERVYNGEDASEFGLKPHSRILWFLENDNTWADMSYRSLDQGDIWRKQLPCLTKKGGEV